MSNAQAKALAKQIVAECYKGPFARYGSVQDWEQCIAKHLTAILDAREQEVWEKVDKYLEEKVDEHFQNINTQARLAIEEALEWCRRQGGRG